MTNFGRLLKYLRLSKGMTLHEVARKIGSHKGYLSGIESGKVNPPSVKVVRKLAKLFHQDERRLVLVAWIDKAPPLIQPDLAPLLKASNTGIQEQSHRYAMSGSPQSE